MIRHSKDGYCISLPFVVKCSCKPPEKTTTLLPPVITTDNNLITAHRIGEQTARNYMRLYRDANQLPPKHNARSSHIAPCTHTTPAGMEEFEAMTKEELIQELVKARITEARLKKGYEVKGDGTVILYGSRNTR